MFQKQKKKEIPGGIFKRKDYLGGIIREETLKEYDKVSQ